MTHSKSFVCFFCRVVVQLRCNIIICNCAKTFEFNGNRVGFAKNDVSKRRRWRCKPISAIITRKNIPRAIFDRIFIFHFGLSTDEEWTSSPGTCRPCIKICTVWTLTKRKFVFVEKLANRRARSICICIVYVNLNPIRRTTFIWALRLEVWNFTK